MPSQGAQDGIAQGVTHEFFQACIEFYNLNTMLGGFGFVVMISVVPLFLILRYAANIKRMDNQMVVDKLKLELENQSKLSKKKSKRRTQVQSPASTTTSG
ncbi:hypothetical protein [Rosenbergiella collisarenosi]|uniref:hypothetical protein n=1 Tax=Rosenbergiella collisarenosi TaxID=1544695 RepID=UPI001F4F486F|nr:hypothetical protein [Rosenbergiella collisarenosi]